MRHGQPAMFAVKLDQVQAEFNRIYPMAVDGKDPKRAAKSRQVAFNRALMDYLPSQYQSDADEDGIQWLYCEPHDKPPEPVM
jgi:hypothetical protein